MNDYAKDSAERFDEKFGKDYSLESKPYDYIHRSADNTFQMSSYKDFIREVEQEAFERGRLTSKECPHFIRPQEQERCKHCSTN